jgi:hypothetical protein
MIYIFPFSARFPPAPALYKVSEKCFLFYPFNDAFSAYNEIPAVELGA